MRINNSKTKNIVISAYFLLIVLVIIITVVFNIFINIPLNPVLIFVAVLFLFLGLFVLLFKITKFFEYDSDGLKISILNKGLLSSEGLSTKEHSLEFEKDKLISFKFQNFIVYKRLVIHLINSRGHVKKEIFNVTLVERKKRKYVRQSLNKVIRHNKKQKVKIDDRR